MRLENTYRCALTAIVALLLCTALVNFASQQEFYAKITLSSSDQQGQAPLLWSAIALLRPDCPGVR